MSGQQSTARRNPQTLDTYVQAAIDANTSPTPSAAKTSRRRRKKRQQEAPNPMQLTLQAKTVVPPVPPARAKPKRRKRKMKLKNAHLQPLQRCKFRVRGLVTAEELEDDEAEEALEEVRVDFERFGEVQEIVIVKGEEVDYLVGDVAVTFQNSLNAASAFDAYKGKVFGGKTVTCTWEMQSDGEKNPVVVVSGMLTPEELEDPDEVADVKEEMMQIFTKHGQVKDLQLSEVTGEATVSFSEECDAVKVVQVMNGSIYGGRDVTARLRYSNGKAHSDGESATNQAEMATKRVATPIIPVVMHSKAPATVDCQILTALLVLFTMKPTESPELQNLVGLFLKRLAALQERAHTQNKASKRSRRLVLGMHEVLRGLRCNKVVLLIIATDLNGGEAVEEKYRELVTIATEHDVPILAPVNRRKFGRMLQKSVRVSCVGVYSVEGANGLYQQILQNMRSIT